MMMESLIKNKPAINAALLENNRTDLMITQDQFENMEAICSFLKEFRDIGTLKKKNDNHIVKKMKPVMLTKLNNRYSTQQMKFFRMCTLLDVRYKNNPELYGKREVYNEAYEDLENNVRHIVE